MLYFVIVSMIHFEISPPIPIFAEQPWRRQPNNRSTRAVPVTGGSLLAAEY